MLEVEFLFDFVGESFDEGPLYAVVFDGRGDCGFGAADFYADVADGESGTEHLEECFAVGEFGVVVPSHGVCLLRIWGRAGLWSVRM